MPNVCIKNLDDLICAYQYFLLDAYGVFWGSSEVGLLSGAKQAMKYLVSKGKRVGILSNSTQLASKEKTKLLRHGLNEKILYHFLLTSGEVTRKLLLSDKLPFPITQKKYFLFGTEHPRFSPHSLLFQGSKFSHTKNMDEADFIYLTIPHINGEDQETPDAFLDSIQNISEKKIPILCANPDGYAHEGSPPRLVVRQGTIAHLFESYGAPVYFVGKPYPTVFAEAMTYYPPLIKAKEVLMIGDNPETDIYGANRFGMSSALVTQTGIMKNSDPSSLKNLCKPDHLISSLKITDV